MPTYACVGLDVSQTDARVCFLLADGSEPRSRWTIPNTQPGADTLSAELARLCQLHQIDQLRIGVEATGLLCWHLACALKDAPVLAPFAPRSLHSPPSWCLPFGPTSVRCPKATMPMRS